MLKLEANNKKTGASSKNFKSIESLSNSTLNDDYNAEMDNYSEDLNLPKASSYSSLSISQENNALTEFKPIQNTKIGIAKKNAAQAFPPAKTDQPIKKINNRTQNLPLKVNAETKPVISNHLSQKINQNAKILPLKANHSIEGTNSPTKYSETPPVISENLIKKMNQQAKNGPTKVDNSTEDIKNSKKNINMAPKAKPRLID